MNRRRFIQSLAGVLSLPAFPSLTLRSAGAAMPLPMATAVPAQARSWAMYMSALHGECTPQTLQNLLNIPAVDAQNYIGQLVADGAIKQTPLLNKTVSNLTKSDEDTFFDRLRQRLEMKRRSNPEDGEAENVVQSLVDLEDENEPFDLSPEDDREEVVADELSAGAEEDRRA